MRNKAVTRNNYNNDFAKQLKNSASSTLLSDRTKKESEIESRAIKKANYDKRK